MAVTDNNAVQPSVDADAVASVAGSVANPVTNGAEAQQQGAQQKPSAQEKKQGGAQQAKVQQGEGEAEAVQEERTVRIWDDAESRIHFLETILKGKEWEAVIYHPDFAPDGSYQPGESTPLPELAQKLAARGYKTELGQDENGIPTLNVRKFGTDTALTAAVKELGFAKGMTHKLKHINQPIGQVIAKVADVAKFALTDKARLIGSAYLVGDLFLAFAGGSGHSKDKLKGIAGVAATIQSLVYMGFAKDGSETMFDELSKTAKEATKQGKDLLDASAWQQVEQKSKNPLSLGHNLLKKYPLQIGAFTQVAGQAAFFAAGARNFASGGNKAGAATDMMTALASAVGWSIASRPSKEIDAEDKVDWSNPKRIWQEVQAHPSKFASGLMAAATVTGITGGVLDRDPSNPRPKYGSVKEAVSDLYAHSNKPQVLAYTTYLLGDGIMFATDSGDYGAAGANNADMLAGAAEEFVKTSPMVLGEQEQAQFVGNLSNYLAERATHQVAKKEKREVREGEVEDLSQRINANLTAKLPPVNERTNEVAGKIAAIAQQFAPEQAADVVDKLCDTVVGVTGVSITKEELRAHVGRQVEQAAELSDKPVTLSRVEKPLANLVQSLPGAANAEVVDRFYSALEGHIQQERPVAQHKPVGQHSAAVTAQRQNGQNKPLSI